MELMQADASPHELNGTQQVVGPRRQALAFADGRPTAFRLAISERVESPENRSASESEASRDALAVRNYDAPECIVKLVCSVRMANTRPSRAVALHTQPQRT